MAHEIDEDLMVDVDSIISFVDQLPATNEATSLEDFCQAIPSIHLNSVPPNDQQHYHTLSSSSSPINGFSMNNETEIPVGCSPHLEEDEATKLERRRKQIRLASRRCRMKKKQDVREIKKRVEELEIELMQQKKINRDMKKAQVELKKGLVNEDTIINHAIFKDIQKKFVRVLHENEMLREEIVKLRCNKQCTPLGQSSNATNNVNEKMSMKPTEFIKLAEKTYDHVEMFSVDKTPRTQYMQILDWNIVFLREGSKFKFSCSKLLQDARVWHHLRMIADKLFLDMGEGMDVLPEVKKIKVLHRFNDDMLLIHRIEQLSPGMTIDRDLVTLHSRKWVSDSKVYMGSRSVELNEIDVEEGCVRAEEYQGLSLSKVSDENGVGVFVEYSGYYDCKEYVTKDLECIIRDYFILEILYTQIEIQSILLVADSIEEEEEEEEEEENCFTLDE